MRAPRWLLPPLLLTTLLACGQPAHQTQPATPPESRDLTPPDGAISGTVTFAQPLTEAVEDATNVIPGRILVKFRPSLQAQALSTLTVAGISVQRVRTLTLDGTALYQVPSGNAQTTMLLAQQLAARPDVEYAEPDRTARPLLQANDPGFDLQWNLRSPSTVAGGINMPAAWDISTGAASTVVAVLDTGILYRAANPAGSHPDLDASRLLPGYDFISNSNCSSGLPCSGDGDGRDDDPYDPGRDQSGGSSSYHGTLVSGIVGAATNNARGVAGVNWHTRLLPVRVLGTNGGSISDIIDGLLWAAGLSAPDLTNPNPADVINLSLGGKGACPRSVQDAINAALSGPKTPVLVVAAGNSNEDASGTFPANCQGVITVGATDQHGNRTTYSNYGLVTSVMAPGGDPRQSYNGTRNAGGILSLTKDDVTGNFTYVYQAGTSFAAPHVAGVVALMRGVNPSLSGNDAKNILQRTARPLNSTSCARPNGADCGAGIIDAARALQAAAQSVDNPAADFTLTVPEGLTVSPGTSDSVPVIINRTNGFKGDVSFKVTGLPAGVKATFSSASSGEDGVLTVQVGSSVPKGTYALGIEGVSGSRIRKASITLVVPEEEASLERTIVAALHVISEMEYDPRRSRSIQLAATTAPAAYRIPDLSPGEYDVIAFRDDNGNGLPDEGEYFDLFPAVVSPPQTNVNLALRAPVTPVKARTSLSAVRVALEALPRQK